MDIPQIKDKNRISLEETREMQRIILGILEAIDKVCRKHNLQYFMIAGTMLGAVRHHGFIPWDDDADVALPRHDYEVLLAHANEWLPEEYELVDYEKDSHYPYQFARIQDKRTTYILRRSFKFLGGIPVDVFPIDGMTENRLARKQTALLLAARPLQARQRHFLPVLQNPAKDTFTTENTSGAHQNTVGILVFGQ